ncbi:MAG: DUF4258 domain-containing protein [Lachnospiraceae bacterium]|nr:DUF4258 domain-containing protein [Lachnospiraceae bacterium]
MILDKIKEFCIERRLKWSSHAASRMQERRISRVDVIHCLNNGEIIEDYPADYPHPSCLVFGYTMQADMKTRKECYYVFILQRRNHASDYNNPCSYFR